MHIPRYHTLIVSNSALLQDAETFAKTGSLRTLDAEITITDSVPAPSDRIYGAEERDEIVNSQNVPGDELEKHSCQGNPH